MILIVTAAGKIKAVNLFSWDSASILHRWFDIALRESTWPRKYLRQNLYAFQDFMGKFLSELFRPRKSSEVF